MPHLSGGVESKQIAVWNRAGWPDALHIESHRAIGQFYHGGDAKTNKKVFELIRFSVVDYKTSPNMAKGTEILRCREISFHDTNSLKELVILLAGLFDSQLRQNASHWNKVASDQKGIEESVNW